MGEGNGSFITVATAFRFLKIQGLNVCQFDVVLPVTVNLLTILLQFVCVIHPFFLALCNFLDFSPE